MFESNFPVDKGSCSYQALWNAFKRIAAGTSTEDKHALFAERRRGCIGSPSDAPGLRSSH